MPESRPSFVLCGHVYVSISKVVGQRNTHVLQISVDRLTTNVRVIIPRDSLGERRTTLDFKNPHCKTLKYTLSGLPSEIDLVFNPVYCEGSIFLFEYINYLAHQIKISWPLNSPTIVIPIQRYPIGKLEQQLPLANELSFKLQLR